LPGQDGKAQSGVDQRYDTKACKQTDRPRKHVVRVDGKGKMLPGEIRAEWRRRGMTVHRVMSPRA
jgi:hypothetical protein